ncbi:hypothetical protein T4A_3474 [Trichinella pseudospiralis]|uniref:Uncharacterized protein n=1 Tax=Trichinella pseudospiralis TaxID=6337 RepID=A0A0V1E6T5_TRIPS|nr:hypothetical protein T4A_3474 [Trichinella pseudospiralis]
MLCDGFNPPSQSTIRLYSGALKNAFKLGETFLGCPSSLRAS